MNKKFFGIAAIVVVFALGFLYLNQSYLVASDKDGKTCDKNGTSCSKTSSSCDDKNKSAATDVKAGGEFSSYEFTTDQVSCEETKANLEKELTSVAGVKEVKFGSTCSVSQMTSVTVYYAAGETNEEAIASFVKSKNIDCSGKTGCNKEKSSDVKKDAGKDGCDGKKECPSKNKKSSDSKQL
jgi:hypothetical protein